MEYKTFSDLGDIKGKRVLVKVDFNVPIKDGKVAEDFRIKEVLPTIEELKRRGARVILMSHIGGDEQKSLWPVYEYLSALMPVRFVSDYGEGESSHLQDITEGEIILLENLRRHPGEKGNDDQFAKNLAALGGIYVNDAFSASHRELASVTGVPKYMPSFMGPLFEKEIKNLSRVFNPTHPFLFILGGVKFETKLPLVEKLFPVADKIFVGGALANDFFKIKNLPVGKSVVSDKDFGLGRFVNDAKLILPVDVVVRTPSGSIARMPTDVGPDDIISDAGSLTLQELQLVIDEAKFILWNGPLGNYEQGFKNGTLELASMIAGSKAESVVGGGDTLSAISELDVHDRFSFISTGGGAMLDFLAKGTSPGIEALKTSAERGAESV